MNISAWKKARKSWARYRREWPVMCASASVSVGFISGYSRGHDQATSDARKLFDAVIDVLYEFDLGEALPVHWPPEVRKAIEASRKRIMRSRRAGQSDGARIMADGRPVPPLTYATRSG